MSIKTTAYMQPIMGVSLLAPLIEEYGIEPSKILHRAGIDASLLSQPDAQISYQQDTAFVRAMLEEIADPALGFKAGERLNLSAFGNVGLAAATCNTVQEAIEFFLQYMPISYTYFTVSFHKTGSNAVLQFSDMHNLGALKAFYIERDFAFAAISTRAMYPRSTKEKKFKAIHFDFSRPCKKLCYEDLYECPVLFEQKHNAILFDASYLERKLLQANPLTHQLLAQQCEKQSRELANQQTYTHKIQKLIQQEEGIPSLENIAQRLHTTSRTIRRKLKVENASFQELANKELSKKAIYHLENSRFSIEQIALLLGYSEAASFIHAFKRWTGKAPKAYQKNK